MGGKFGWEFLKIKSSKFFKNEVKHNETGDTF